MKLLKNQPRWKAALIGGGLFIMCGFIFLGIAVVRNGFDLSHISLPEHTSLFTETVQSKLSKPFVFKSKIQGAQSNYNLPDDLHLTIYQVALKDDKPLGQILKLNDKKPSKTYEVYTPYGDNQFVTMTKSSSEVDDVSSVSFRYDGPLIKSLAQSDSLAYYYLKFNKFSISYDDLGNDVWAISKTSASPSLNLAFIKKKKTLYVVMLYKNENQDKDFAPDKLYNMLKK